MEKNIIEVGQRVVFDPLDGIKVYGFEERGRREVVGTVVQVYKDHRYFSVEYEENGQKLRTSFNFNDINKTVTICEEGA